MGGEDPKIGSGRTSESPKTCFRKGLFFIDLVVVLGCVAGGFSNDFQCICVMFKLIRGVLSRNFESDLLAMFFPKVSERAFHKTGASEICSMCVRDNTKDVLCRSAFCRQLPANSICCTLSVPFGHLFGMLGRCSGTGHRPFKSKGPSRA